MEISDLPVNLYVVKVSFAFAFVLVISKSECNAMRYTNRIVPDNGATEESQMFLRLKRDSSRIDVDRR